MAAAHPPEPVADRPRPSRSVPLTILHAALSGFGTHVGEMLRAGRSRHPAYVPLHPGDTYGQVLAWLWHADRNLAMLLLYDTTVAMHPVYRLEDLLRGAIYALPSDFADYDQLCATARVQVAQLHGKPGI